MSVCPPVEVHLVCYLHRIHCYFHLASSLVQLAIRQDAEVLKTLTHMENCLPWSVVEDLWVSYHGRLWWNSGYHRLMIGYIPFFFVARLFLIRVSNIWLWFPQTPNSTLLRVSGCFSAHSGKTRFQPVEVDSHSIPAPFCLFGNGIPHRTVPLLSCKNLVWTVFLRSPSGRMVAIAIPDHQLCKVLRLPCFHSNTYTPVESCPNFFWPAHEHVVVSLSFSFVKGLQKQQKHTPTQIQL